MCLTKMHLNLKPTKFISKIMNGHLWIEYILINWFWLNVPLFSYLFQFSLRRSDLIYALISLQFYAILFTINTIGFLLWLKCCDNSMVIQFIKYISQLFRSYLKKEKKMLIPQFNTPSEMFFLWEENKGLTNYL